MQNFRVAYDRHGQHFHFVNHIIKVAHVSVRKRVNALPGSWVVDKSAGAKTTFALHSVEKMFDANLFLQICLELTKPDDAA